MHYCSRLAYGLSHVTCAFGCWTVLKFVSQSFIYNPSGKDLYLPEYAGKSVFQCAQDTDDGVCLRIALLLWPRNISIAAVEKFLMSKQLSLTKF